MYTAVPTRKMATASQHAIASRRRLLPVFVMHILNIVFLLVSTDSAVILWHSTFLLLDVAYGEWELLTPMYPTQEDPEIVLGPCTFPEGFTSLFWRSGSVGSFTIIGAWAEVLGRWLSPGMSFSGFRSATLLRKFYSSIY